MGVLRDRTLLQYQVFCFAAGFNTIMFRLKHLQFRLIPGTQMFGKTTQRSASSHGAHSKSASLIKIGAHGYSLLVIPVMTFGLGTWQIYRRQWKISVIDNLATRTSATPIPLPDNLEDLTDMEYRKFELIGTFQHDKEVYVGPRSAVEDKNAPSTGGLLSSGQSGYHVITPFKISGSDLTVLVNRGWVSRNKMNPATRPKGQTDSEIRLVHYRDVESMSRLLDTAPVYFDADSDSTVPDGPIGGQTVVTVRNEHMSYILTWYSLSIVTSYLWYRRFIKKLPLM